MKLRQLIVPINQKHLDIQRRPSTTNFIVTNSVQSSSLNLKKLNSFVIIGVYDWQLN